MANKYELTHEQFMALRQSLKQRSGSERFDDVNVDMAYRVMVLREAITTVAEETGKARQGLHRVIRDLWFIHNGEQPPSRSQQKRKPSSRAQRTGKYPQDWIQVCVTVPPDLADAVTKIEALARARLLNQQDIEGNE